MHPELTNLTSNKDKFDYLALFKGFFTWNTKEPLSRKNFWLALGCNFLLWFSISIAVFITSLVQIGFINVNPIFNPIIALASLFFVLFFIYLAARRLKDLNVNEGGLAFFFKPKTFYIYIAIQVLIGLFLYDENLRGPLLIGINFFFGTIFFLYIFAFLCDENASLLSKKPLSFKSDLLISCFSVLILGVICVALFSKYLGFDFLEFFDWRITLCFITFLFLIFTSLFFYQPNFISKIFSVFVFVAIVMGVLIVLFLGIRSLTFVMLAIPTIFYYLMLALCFWALNYKNVAVFMLAFSFLSSSNLNIIIGEFSTVDSISLLLKTSLFTLFIFLSFWKKFNDFDKNKAGFVSFILAFTLLLIGQGINYLIGLFSTGDPFTQFKFLLFVTIAYFHFAFHLYVFYYFAHKNLANKTLKLLVLGLLLLSYFILSTQNISTLTNLDMRFMFFAKNFILPVLLTLLLVKKYKFFAFSFLAYSIYSLHYLILKYIIFPFEYIINDVITILLGLLFITTASLAIYKQYKKVEKNEF